MKFSQVALNAFEVTISDKLYRVTVHRGQFRVYTWNNNEWDFNLPVDSDTQNILAKEVSANYSHYLV